MIHTPTQLRTLGTERLQLTGRFWTNAALDPATVWGRGMSVSYSGSGVWVITFPTAIYRVIGLGISTGGACAGNVACVIANEGTSDALTITLTHEGGANIAAAADNWFAFIAECEMVRGG